jgi:RimJ/RimL family protein N-acetyltransferase
MSHLNFHITTPRLYLSYCNPDSSLQSAFMSSVLHGAPSRKWHPGALSDIPDEHAARSAMAAQLPRLLKLGFGRYLVSLRPSSAEEDESIPFSERELVPIGYVSMQMARVEGVAAPTIPDVGFNMHEMYHGKGYATEAVEGLMKYFREDNGFSAFAGLTNEKNEGARRLFRRLGFKEWGVRSVGGIMWTGKPADIDVWTFGVEEGRELEEYGF